MNKSLGFVNTPSTTLDVKLLVKEDSGLDPLKNQMVYLDIETNNGTKHRGIGFINEITTMNTMNNDGNLLSASTRISGGLSNSSDYRAIDIKIASVFNNEDGEWKSNKPLPTSPSTGTEVYPAGNDVIRELFKSADEETFAYLGHLRGAADVPAPLMVPYFGSGRGSSHSAIVGKTGSGKTSFTTYLLGSQMKYEDHAIIVVDPQGQWNNENGFPFSVKGLASSLGREVFSLRVSEDIQLDLNEENFVGMITQLDLWSKLGRMAKENRDLLTGEVADYILSFDAYTISKKDNREFLTEILNAIIESPASVARIYASEDKQFSLKQSILSLTNPDEAAVRAYANSQYRNIEKTLKDLGMEADFDAVQTYAKEKCEEKGLIPVPQDELDKVEARWNGILAKFTPLMSLFMPRNLSGGKRTILGDADREGFLTKILKIREQNPDKPAPYVVLDMSPDPTIKAKAQFIGGANSELNMKKLLDNDSIKATILGIVFSALKEASEAVFDTGGGNLNTQIIFDEAWRYAPERSDNEIIQKLSGTLEGFALDTRKYGIGWTYILQSPGDLRAGIWRQLKYVYSGYGLVGADLNRVGELMDDAQTQLKTYKQFVTPDMTGEYPFMITGSISPLITAQIPLFLNAYNTVEEYVADNAGWMNVITKRRSKAAVMAKNIRVGSYRSADDSGTRKPAQGYSVGSGGNPESRIVATEKVENTSRKVATPTSGLNEAVKPPF